MFKVGDAVVIQSYDVVRTTLDRYGMLKENSIAFDETMAAYCEDQATVIQVFESHGSPRLKLKDIPWVWHPDWLVPQILDNRRIGNV